MKIAAGCFGCLAFLFLILTFATGIIVATLISFAPDQAATLSAATSYIQYANGTCCCLSAALAFVLLAAGSMRKKDSIE